MAHGHPGDAGTQSRIDRVRVYRRGATVTRVVELGEVPETVRLVGLPLGLLDPTVRVRVLAGDCTAGAPRIGLHAKAPEDLPETPDETALRELRRTIQRDEARIETLRSEAGVLESIEVPPRPQVLDAPPRTSPMAARVALERFTHDRIDERLAEIRRLESGLVGLREDLLAREDALRRANRRNLASRQSLSKALEVDLRGTRQGPLRLEVDYHVPGARWAPSYQCHVDPVAQSASIHQRAVVIQDSGEDWQQAVLELSTALPQRFSELPKLSALRIGRSQPEPPVPGFRAPPTGSASLFADFDRGPRPAPSTPGFLHDWVEQEMDDDAFSAPPMAMAMADAEVAAPPSPAVRASGAPRKARAKREAVTAPPPSEPTLPDFANLRLAGPRSPDRGHLLPDSTTDRYRRSLDALGLAVEGDLETLLKRARHRAEAAARVRLPAGMFEVVGTAGAFDHTYVTEHRVDVPSAPAFHSIPLASRDTEVTLTHVVVPRVDPNVFRVADLLNPTHSPLLPGPVEVYVDGRYVLSSRITLVGPGERFQLGLGVEQGIRCARNTTYRETRSGSAVVAMNELHHTVTIELHNQLGRPIRAEVRERLPAAAEGAEVAVEEVEVQPAWEPWDQREVGGTRLQAGRRWQLPVQAGERITLLAHYVVKIYANNELVDGNRREA